MRSREEQRYCQSNCEHDDPCITQIWSQIKKIRKQIKHKVDRNQFTTAMSSKLSLSEISRLSKNSTRDLHSYQLTKRSKQNIPNENIIYNTKHNFQKSKKQEFAKTNLINQQSYMEKFQQKYLDLLFNVNSRVSQLQSNVPNIRDELWESNDETLTKIQKIFKQIQEQNLKISEIDAIIYHKADRSEMQKVFKLNDLLVVEVQQIKQYVKDILKSNRDDYCRANIQHQKKILKFDEFVQDTTKSLQNSQKQINQLHKLLHQMSNSSIQKNQQKNMQKLNKQIQSSKIQNSVWFRQLIDDSMQNIRKQISNQTFQLRQFATRINVLEHKQSQVTRAAMQIDEFKQEITSFKIQLNSMNSRTQYLSESTKQYCKTSLTKATKQIYEKIQNQLQQSCEILTQKMLKLLDESVLKQEFQKQIHRINEKTQRISQKQNILDHKVQEIRLKSYENEQKIDEQAQKTQQQLVQIDNTIRKSSTSLKNQLVSILQTKYINSEQLSEIVLKLDQKIYKQYQKNIKEQSRINQILCSQNILGKWIWNTGKLKGGNLISWDKELANTLPQNFKWLNIDDPVGIQIQNSGFYKIQMGFFAKKKPTVQLIVNGKTVISAVNSNSYVLHHSSGRLKQVGNISQVVGLTYVDFIMIKETSRIAVSFSGQHTGDGFMLIQRL